MHTNLDSSNNKTVIDVFNITIAITNNFTGRKLFYVRTKARDYHVRIDNRFKC